MFSVHWYRAKLEMTIQKNTRAASVFNNRIGYKAEKIQRFGFLYVLYRFLIDLTRAKQ